VADPSRLFFQRNHNTMEWNEERAGHEWSSGSHPTMESRCSRVSLFGHNRLQNICLLVLLAIAIYSPKLSGTMDTVSSSSYASAKKTLWKLWEINIIARYSITILSPTFYTSCLSIIPLLTQTTFGSEAPQDSFLHKMLSKKHCDGSRWLTL